MLYGTMARYMRRVREVFQPKNIMINCETTPEALSQWALENWNFNRTSYANDYTAFDQSKDGAMLQFEILKARHHSIPDVYIDGYVELKCCSKTFLGVLKIMRLTGEGPTFDANTECNIAFAHTKLKIPIGTAQLYAGDDCAYWNFQLGVREGNVALRVGIESGAFSREPHNFEYAQESF